MAERTSEGSELLHAFLGDWWAEGTSYGGDDQSPESPHAGESPWRSTHTARWLSGGYFLVQDERANGPFDTLTVMGWDRDAERFFARSFENHGFSRDYTMTFDGLAVRLGGEYERATYTFDAAGDTQTVAWQWAPRGELATALRSCRAPRRPPPRLIEAGGRRPERRPGKRSSAAHLEH